MSCDVGQFLPADDRPVAEVEGIVHLAHTAFPRVRRQGGRRGRSFLPRGALEFTVVTEEGEPLTLLAYSNKWAYLFAELHRGDQKLRSLHTHPGHRNPGHQDEMPDGHMHFPTERYSLVGSKSSYAYEVDCIGPDSPEDFVELFCAILGIDIDSLQFLLDTGGRR